MACTSENLHTNIAGVIHSGIDSRRTDYLFRISLKALIVDSAGRVLMVKEKGRDWWGLPGGGMDHGESIHDCLARELAEEVNLRGDFTFEPIDIIETPDFLPHIQAYQVRIIVRVRPEIMEFSPGEDGEAVAFMAPNELKGSIDTPEKLLQHIRATAERSGARSKY